MKKLRIIKKIAAWCWATLPRRIISCICIVSILLSSVWYLFLKPQPVQAAWWDEDWTYRKKITIDISKISADVADLPVLVKLTSAELDFTKAQSAGQDVRFVDAYGNSLKYEIEDWTQATSTADVWVRIPLITSTKEAYIYMYYGNSTATDGQSATAVWDSSFKGVWHLGNAASPALDSTSNGYSGTQNGGVTFGATGKVGKGTSYDGSDDYIVTSNLVSTPTKSVTIEVWFFATAGGVILDEIGAPTSPTWYDSQIEIMGTGEVKIRVWNLTAVSLGTVSMSTWNHAVLRYDIGATKLEGFLNGNLISTSSSGTRLVPWENSAGLYYGFGRADATNLGDGTAHNGSIDEVRISSVPRSNAWIKADYNSQNNTLLSYGKEETGSGPILWYRFSEGYGTTAYDSSNQSGTRNNGTITNATWTDSGKFGKALNFDGTGDYVNVGKDIGLSNGVFTVVAWIKVNTYANNPTIVAGDSWSYPQFRVNTDGKLQFVKSNVTSIGISNTVLSTSKWHLAGLTYNGSDYKFYLDGILDGSGTSAQTFTSRNTLVGSNNGTEEFNGVIDEFKVYNYVRTAAQIKKDYDKGAVVRVGGDDSWITDGLVGYWKMNEASWNGTSGQVIDSSGVGNNATSAGGATTAAGHFANAGTFDGNGDYVRSAVFVTPDSTLTISAWIKTTATARQVIVEQGRSSANYEGQYGVEINELNYPGTFVFWDYKSGYGFPQGTGGSTVAINDGRWHHIVFTKNGLSGTYYTDGVVTGTKTATQDVDYVDVDFVIGEDYADNSLNFNGLLDDVRIYNRALSSQEVSRLYNWAPPPVAEWRMDEGSGASIQDVSENANTGTITGATWKNSAQCHSGSCLNFDGNDSVLTGTVPVQASTTVSLWAKAANSNVTSYGAVIRAPAIADGFGIYQYANDGSWAIYTDSGWALSPDDTVAGRWYHLVLVQNATTATLYVNGVSKAVGNDCPNMAAAPFYIGYDTYGSQYFIGNIDEVKIFNYELTQRQINELYNDSGPDKAKNPVNSTVGYWKFDEGAGATAYDSSGNSNNGTITGATTTMSGKFGKALSFDGNDYVALGTPTSLDLTSQMTLSAWVNLTSLPTLDTWSTVVEKGWDGSKEQFWLSFKNTSGVQSIQWYSYDGSYHGMNFVYTITTGVWHHLVANWDGSAWNLYIDGALVNSVSDATGPTHTAKSIQIGAANISDTITRYFNGIIDEVKILPFALTKDDVLMEYNRGKAMLVGGDQSNAEKYCPPGFTGTCNAPIAEWKMDEAGGTSVQDTSANTNTGSMYGNPVWKNATQCHSASCLSFDGSDDYIQSTTTPITTTNGSCTVSVWFKTNSNTTNQGIVGYWDGNNRGNGTSLFLTTSGAVKFNYYDENLPGDRTLDSSSTSFTVAKNTWYHAVAVYSSTSQKLYINGVPVASAANNSNKLIDAAVYFKLGKSYVNGVGDGFLNGLADDVKIYDYALTQEQVNWLYNNGKPAVYWKFNEGSGTTTKDTTTGNNTGNITGATWTTSGKYGGALSFDGSGDYVESASNLGATGANSRTISFWSKINVIADGVIVSTGSAGNGNLFAALCYQGNWYGNGYGASYDFDTLVACDTNWHYHALVYTGTVMQWYKDGLLIGSKVMSLDTTANKLRVGRRIDNWGDFNGIVDEVKVFNYALNAEQIKLDYNQESAMRFGQ